MGHRKDNTRLAICALAGFLCLFIHGEPRAQLNLFTEEEAQQLRMTEQEFEMLELERLKVVGPLVVFQSPEPDGNVIVTTTPFDLIVSFEANPLAVDPAPVDMTTLAVWAKKGPFRKDLMPLLAEYVQGTAIHAEGIDIPAGRFQIKVRIGDQQDQTTVQTHKWHVQEP